VNILTWVMARVDVELVCDKDFEEFSEHCALVCTK